MQTNYQRLLAKLANKRKKAMDNLKNFKLEELDCNLTDEQIKAKCDHILGQKHFVNSNMIVFFNSLETKQEIYNEYIKLVAKYFYYLICVLKKENFELASHIRDTIRCIKNEVDLSIELSFSFYENDEKAIIEEVLTKFYLEANRHLSSDEKK